MPRITLQLGIEGSADVARSLQGLTTAARTAFASMKAEANAAANSILQGHRRIVAGEQQTLNARRLIMAQAVNAWKTSEAAMVAAVVQGSSNRLRLVQNEVTQRKQLLDSIRNTASQTERAVTRTIEEEARKRIAAQAAVGAAATAAARAGAGGSGGGRSRGEAPSSAPAGGGFSHRAAGLASRAVSATIGAGFQAMDMIHDARYRRAATAETLTHALTQVGGSRQDVQTAMGLVTGTAARRGLGADGLAAAVEAAQTEFVALGDRGQYRNMAPGARSAALQTVVQRQLDRAVAGRNLGADPREYLRLGAMMDQNHVPDVENTLADFVAMAERGAVPLGTIAGTALQPMLRSMATAQGNLPATATAAERGAVANRVMRETFAFDETLKSRGWDPRAAGTTLANMETAMGGNLMAERAHTNLVNARRSAQGEQATALDRVLTGDNALFEPDPNQRGHLRFRDSVRGHPMALASELSAAGVSGQTAENIFAGGGPGNARSFQAPWRRLNSALQAADANGQTGFAAVKEVMSSTHTPEERARMADAYENSPMATFVRQEEQRLTALSDNTSALGRLSERLDQFRAEHPIAAPLLESAGTALLGAGAGQLAGLLMGGGAGAGGGGMGLGLGLGLGAGGGGAFGTFMAGGGLLAGGLALGGAAAFTGLALGANQNAETYIAQTASRDQRGAMPLLADRDRRVDFEGRPMTELPGAVATQNADGSLTESPALVNYVPPTTAADRQAGANNPILAALSGGGAQGFTLSPAGMSQFQQAMTAALGAVTLKTEATPASAVSAGTQGASNAANRTASPQ